MNRRRALARVAAAMALLALVAAACTDQGEVIGATGDPEDTAEVDEEVDEEPEPESDEPGPPDDDLPDDGDAVPATTEAEQSPTTVVEAPAAVIAAAAARSAARATIHMSATKVEPGEPTERIDMASSAGDGEMQMTYDNPFFGQLHVVSTADRHHVRSSRLQLCGAAHWVVFDRPGIEESRSYGIGVIAVGPWQILASLARPERPAELVGPDTIDGTAVSRYRVLADLEELLFPESVSADGRSGPPSIDVLVDADGYVRRIVERTPPTQEQNETTLEFAFDYSDEPLALVLPPESAVLPLDLLPYPSDTWSCPRAMGTPIP